MFSFIFNLIFHFFHLFTDSCTPGPCSFPPRPRRSQRISGTGREFSFQNVGGCLRFWPGRFLNERFSCCLTWNARPSSRLSKQGRHASFPSGLTSRPLPTLSSIKQTAVRSPHTGVQSSLTSMQSEHGVVNMLLCLCATSLPCFLSGLCSGRVGSSVSDAVC